MWNALSSAVDLRTAYLLGGLVALLSGATVGMLRGLHEPSRAAVTTLAWSLCATAIAQLLAAGRGMWPDVVAVRLALVAACTGAVLMLAAVRSLYGRDTPPRVLRYALGTVAVLVLVLPGPKASIVLTFTVLAACALMGGRAALQGREPGAPAGRIGLLALLSVMAIGTALRALDVAILPAHAITEGGAQLGSLQGPVAIVFALGGLALMILSLKIVYGRLLADVRHQAVTDELTGLSSRRHLFGHGDPWLTARSRAANFTALMMIDVDHFKSINDRFGHDVGDRVLRHVATVLRGALRSDSVLARYGGEEFCALVPVQDQNEAEAAAERVRGAVECQPFPLTDGCVDVTVSIGLAFHRPGLTLREVLRTADRRVYYAKACGRNRVVGEADTLQAAIV